MDALHNNKGTRMTLRSIRRRTVLGGALAAGTLALTPRGHAQSWPSKPIKLVAVFPPGGSVDQVARILAPTLSQQLGQPVVVDNKGGASGAIGTAAVAQAEPDGTTFGVVFDTHGVNPSLQKLPFDTLNDLVHVCLVGTGAMVLTSNAKAPFKTFGDVVAAARAGQAVNYGSIGAGSLGHLAMALLGRNNGLAWTHVPYRGGGPLMQDAVAGHVPLAIGSIFLSKPHIDSGALRPLAVTTSKRSADLPDVPTVAESGFPGFDAPAWWGVIAPARTPPAIVTRMNEALRQTLRTPEVAKRLREQGLDVSGSTPDEFRTFVARQMDIWAKVVKDNDIKAGS